MITEAVVKEILGDAGCNLLVAGFPCQDLTSFSWLRRESRGLDGERSGLFFALLQILRWVYQYSASSPPLVIVENNYSMKRENRKQITYLLQEVDPQFRDHVIDSTWVGALQRRRRLFWINRVQPLVLPDQTSIPKQTWSQVLLPFPDTTFLLCSDEHIQNQNTTYPVKNQNRVPILALQVAPRRYVFRPDLEQKGRRSRWEMNMCSDTARAHALVVVRTRNSVLVRYPDEPEVFQVRSYHPIELERLFQLPDGYVSNLCSRTQSARLLGNAVVVSVVRYLVDHFL
jgi:site-specific DNA-cytosine methylase